VTGHLRGCAVLVTRARHQAAGLSRALESAGARVAQLPTVEIRALDSEDLNDRAHSLVPPADWLIFVSPNAAGIGCELLERLGVTPATGCRIGAVGAGTARELERRGLGVDAVPETGGGGEALLRLAALADVGTQRVVIVRGVGGRETLAEALRARGAHVDYLEVYRRDPARVDPGAALRDWRQSAARFTILTSATGLTNLLRLVDSVDRERLLESRVITVSERLAGLVREAGFRRPAVVADGADDAALLQAVRRAAELEDTHDG
jgi:uroporphyrinogen-III synthase